MRTGLFVCLHSAQRLLRACGALRVGVGCVGSLAVQVGTAGGLRGRWGLRWA